MALIVLPNHIISYVVCNWLTLKDVSCLDCALLGEVRKLWNGNGIITDDLIYDEACEYFIRDGKGLIQWLVSRRIWLNWLSINLNGLRMFMDYCDEIRKSDSLSGEQRDVKVIIDEVCSKLIRLDLKVVDFILRSSDLLSDVDLMRAASLFKNIKQILTSLFY